MKNDPIEPHDAIQVPPHMAPDGCNGVGIVLEVDECGQQARVLFPVVRAIHIGFLSKLERILMREVHKPRSKKKIPHPARPKNQTAAARGNSRPAASSPGRRTVRA